MLCSKYTKFVEFTTQRKTSHEHFTEPNGKKDRSQEQAQFEVKGTRKRLFDVFAEQIDTTRMALLKFDATSSMRITGGVQFDVRFVDREGDPNDDPELYKIMQKNWMLVPTESLSRLTFIVSSFPHSLATCDVSTATCTIRSYARQESAAHLGGQILKQWRGGSMLLRTERGLLSVVHSRTYISTEAMYNHALALYSSHFPHRLISLSEPFRLPQPRKSVAEESGIIFLDELDKIAGDDGGGKGPDVSRQGVQRDLLPIVEGTTVNTKYGPVKTDYILFIAAGAFHRSKPSDLMPELQGRFPIRVELKDLTRDDFARILKEPRASLTRQYTALMGADGIQLEFRPDAIEAMADYAFQVNRSTQNIGARRLHTILERVVEELSYDAPDRAEKTVVIDGAYVRERLEALSKDEDLSRFIL